MTDSATAIHYNATGNTFLVLDGRSNFQADSFNWKEICQENQVDGILILSNSKNLDFKMTYLNADGGEVEMCGNGMRALAHFAHEELKLKEQGFYKIETMCGEYECQVNGDYVQILMTELEEINEINVADLHPTTGKSFYTKTGVPHAIFEVGDVAKVDIQNLGAKIRYDKRFPKGSNANFFEKIKDNEIKLRTYERGVEAETGACGTGAMAVGVALNKLYNFSGKLLVHMPGGDLDITLNQDLSEMYLGGKVEKISQVQL